MATIRTATPADAAALAGLAERTFRDTFGAANTAEDMDLHCRSSYAEAFQRAELGDPGLWTLVAEAGPGLAGFAQVRWDHAPAHLRLEAPGEIQRLYVDRAWHGQGVAQALMARCLEGMAARGLRSAWLGVWEHNPRAIAFYRKSGFAVAGAQVFMLGRDPQRDLVMVRAVAAPER